MVDIQKLREVAELATSGAKVTETNPYITVPVPTLIAMLDELEQLRAATGASQVPPSILEYVGEAKQDAMQKLADDLNELQRLRTIVRDLAAKEPTILVTRRVHDGERDDGTPIYDEMTEDGPCALCGEGGYNAFASPRPHAESCPWRRAREAQR